MEADRRAHARPEEADKRTATRSWPVARLHGEVPGRGDRRRCSSHDAERLDEAGARRVVRREELAYRAASCRSSVVLGEHLGEEAASSCPTRRARPGQHTELRVADPPPAPRCFVLWALPWLASSILGPRAARARASRSRRHALSGRPLAWRAPRIALAAAAASGARADRPARLDRALRLNSAPPLYAPRRFAAVAPIVIKSWLAQSPSSRSLRSCAGRAVRAVHTSSRPKISTRLGSSTRRRHRCDPRPGLVTGTAFSSRSPPALTNHRPTSHSPDVGHHAKKSRRCCSRSKSARCERR